jgi:hypothetical protein
MELSRASRRASPSAILSTLDRLFPELAQERTGGFTAISRCGGRGRRERGGHAMPESALHEVCVGYVCLRFACCRDRGPRLTLLTRRSCRTASQIIPQSGRSLPTRGVQARDRTRTYMAGSGTLEPCRAEPHTLPRDGQLWESGGGCWGVGGEPKQKLADWDEDRDTYLPRAMLRAQRHVCPVHVPSMYCTSPKVHGPSRSCSCGWAG